MSATKNEKTWESIPPLETKLQWPKWDPKVRNALKMSGFGRLLGPEKDEAKRYEGETDEQFATRQYNYIQLQSQSCAYVRNRLGDNVAASVETLFDDDDTENLVKLLDEIQSKWQPTGFAYFLELDSKYNTLDLESCENVTDYASKLRKAREEIQKIDKACAIGEPLFIVRFLRGLTPAFDTFLTSYYSQHHLIDARSETDQIIHAAVKFEQVLQAVEAEEQRQKKH